jgi:hypothetical protein
MIGRRVLMVTRAAGVTTVLFALATSTACHDVLTGGRACTAILVFGLNVSVKDASTGERICDATVVAVDRSYTEVLQRAPGGCGYFGAPERPGSYEVRVSRDGYQPVVVRAVRVESDECHVIPVTLDVALPR